MRRYIMYAFQAPLRFLSCQLRKHRRCESTTTTKRPGDGGVITETSRVWIKCYLPSDSAFLCGMKCGINPDFTLLL